MSTLASFLILDDLNTSLLTNIEFFFVFFLPSFGEVAMELARLRSSSAEWGCSRKGGALCLMMKGYSMK